MMRGQATPWGLFLFVTVLVILHFLLRIGFGLQDLAPDLLIVALLLAAREMRAGYAAGVGLILGILEGAIIPFALGTIPLVFTVLGYLGARSRDIVAGDNLVFLAFYLFIGKWVADTLLYLLAGSLFRSAGFSAILLVSPLAALYAALAGLIAISVYRALT